MAISHDLAETHAPRRSLWSRHLLLVVLATSAVTLLPVAGARFFGMVSGLDSIVISIGVGAILSVAISAFGARLWSSMVLSDDIVFGELMLWGWLRRLRSDRRLARATQLLGLDGKGWAPGSHMSAREQARVLQDLASALEKGDPYTHGHSNRVTRYANAMARGMGLDAALVENIRVAASLHDVGKLGVPTEILRKPGALTDQEFQAIKEHPVIGAEMVSQLGNPEIVEMIRHHHERLDGRGYPDRLAGDTIPLGARIIAVADTFDAISSTRSYRKRSNHKKALTILKKESGTQLDRDAVDAFIKYYSGRGTLEWRAIVTTVPQRLLEWIGRSMPSGVAQGATAAAVAVTIAAAPMTLVPDVIRGRFDRDRAHHAGPAPFAAVGAFAEGGDEVDDGIPAREPGSSEGNSNPYDGGDGTEDTTTAPVTDPLADPIREPRDPGGDPIAEPTDPVADPVRDVTDPVTKPIRDVTDPVTKPIEDVTDPVTEPIEDVTDPITEPVRDILDPLVKALPDLGRSSS